MGIAVAAVRRRGAPGARTAAVGAFVALAVPLLLGFGLVRRATVGGAAADARRGGRGGSGAATAVSEVLLAWAAVAALRGGGAGSAGRSAPPRPGAVPMSRDLTALVALGVALTAVHAGLFLAVAAGWRAGACPGNRRRRGGVAGCGGRGVSGGRVGAVRRGAASRMVPRGVVGPNRAGGGGRIHQRRTGGPARRGRVRGRRRRGSRCGACCGRGGRGKPRAPRPANAGPTTRWTPPKSPNRGRRDVLRRGRVAADPGFPAGDLPELAGGLRGPAGVRAEAVPLADARRRGRAVGGGADGIGPADAGRDP